MTARNGLTRGKEDGMMRSVIQRGGGYAYINGACVWNDGPEESNLHS